jgi:hypothetical protein
MKRQIPGLHDETKNAEDFLEGLFLVRVDHVHYTWHPQKPCYLVGFVVLEPQEFHSRRISGRLYCTPKALWRLNWFLRDFGYDTDLLGRDEVDERALLGLKGVVRTSQKRLMGRTYLNLDGFASSAEWDGLSAGGTRAGVEEKGNSDDLQLHTD